MLDFQTLDLLNIVTYVGVMLMQLVELDLGPTPVINQGKSICGPS